MSINTSKDPTFRDLLVQEAMAKRGHYTGALDNDFGPLSKAALAKCQADIKGSIQSVVSIAERVVAAAKTQIGIRETSKNQGPGISKYWTATTYPTGYANREPYCAAFVCWVVKEAVGNGRVTFSLPRSPVAYDAEKWARANAGKGIAFADKPKPGDIFTLAAASHVGIVESVSGSTIYTIEGNTDGSGSREGDGVYRRTRSILGVRKFIRIL